VGYLIVGNLKGVFKMEMSTTAILVKLETNSIYALVINTVVAKLKKIVFYIRVWSQRKVGW
jgi:hypothetical protein